MGITVCKELYLRLHCNALGRLVILTRSLGSATRNGLRKDCVFLYTMQWSWSNCSRIIGAQVFGKIYWTFCDIHTLISILKVSSSGPKNNKDTVCPVLCLNWGETPSCTQTTECVEKDLTMVSIWCSWGKII